MIRVWIEGVQQSKVDRRTTADVEMCRAKIVFRNWFEIFQRHLKARVHMELRVKARDFKRRMNESVAVETKGIRPLRHQVRRNHRILELKLDQFDRLSHAHTEALRTRMKVNRDIVALSNGYFRRSEELHILDFDDMVDDIAEKVAAVRIHMAEAWVYHLSRVARSIDNDIVMRSFANAFRVLADPLVDRAVRYFREKVQIRKLLKIWKRYQRTLRTVVGCAVRYHRHIGWTYLTLFIRQSSMYRTPNLLEVVRRRRELLILFPYSDWVDILPVRPPRPLREVGEIFKDLPMISIRKKVARERVHHINVRILLKKRQVMRDFFRAYASCVQRQVGQREIFRLMVRRRRIRYCALGFDAFRIAANKAPVELKLLPANRNVQADLLTWFRHFVPFLHSQDRKLRRS